MWLIICTSKDSVFFSQVSHHPPIMAFQAESKPGEYVVYGEIEIRNKFWGKSVEVSFVEPINFWVLHQAPYRQSQSLILTEDVSFRLYLLACVIYGFRSTVTTIHGTS